MEKKNISMRVFLFYIFIINYGNILISKNFKHTSNLFRVVVIGTEEYLATLQEDLEDDLRVKNKILPWTRFLVCSYKIGSKLQNKN